MYMHACIQREREGDGRFGKITINLPAKIPCLILNNIINIQIVQSLSPNVFLVNSPKFSPTKVSLYTVVQALWYYW